MNNNDRVFLTEEGYRKLKEELEQLRTVARPRISERIREAKQGGDITESGEYEEAKRDQSFLEGRIREIEATLSRAEVINRDAARKGVVSLGSRVTVEQNGRRETYTVVSKAEAGRGRDGEIRISDVSAVGKALLEKKVGDTVAVTTPGGVVELKIVSVE